MQQSAHVPQTRAEGSGAADGCFQMNTCLNAVPDRGISLYLVQSPWSRTIKALCWTSHLSYSGNKRDERL